MLYISILLYCYTVNICDYINIANFLKPKLLTINILHAFTSGFTLGKRRTTSIYTHIIRTYCTRIDAVFAPVFLQRYNCIIQDAEVLYMACKCPFWPNMEVPDNVDGGIYGGVPVLTDLAQAAKNLKFCNFFIFN